VHARALKEAQTQLVELRHDGFHQLGLGAIAFGASLAMNAIYSPLVLPLFLGGLAMWALGLRSYWRHWDLVDRLANDRDAYVISDVRAYAARDARMERRRANATVIRYWAQQSADPRITDVADDLEQLACDLEDAALELSPQCALACRRLLTDPTVSPLLDGAPADDLHAWIAEIEDGFRAVAHPTTGRSHR
jgi:hypothetical protein